MHAVRGSMGNMSADTRADSGLAVDDLVQPARSTALHLGINNLGIYVLRHLQLPGTGTPWFYLKLYDTPANYIIISPPVDDIDQAAHEPTARGVESVPLPRDGPGRQGD